MHLRSLFKSSSYPSSFLVCEAAEVPLASSVVILVYSRIICLEPMAWSLPSLSLGACNVFIMQTQSPVPATKIKP